MILKHRDKELLRFEWVEQQGVCIVSVNEASRHFLPIDFKGEATDENLWKWLSRRVIPRNRRNIRFKRHKHYNLSSRRLQAIEAFLQKRILQIEKFGEKADDIFKVTQKVGTVNHVNSESLALQIIANLKADPFISYEELSEVLGIPRVRSQGA